MEMISSDIQDISDLLTRDLGGHRSFLVGLRFCGVNAILVSMHLGCRVLVPRPLSCAAKLIMQIRMQRMYQTAKDLSPVQETAQNLPN